MIQSVTRVGCLVAGLAALVLLGGAAPSPPRYASLAAGKVYMREGPSYRHRVLWVYRRKGLPVQILDKYEIWYRVKDSTGTVGWISNVMLSTRRRTIVVTSKRAAPIRNSADLKSPTIAYAQRGVVAKLEACKALTCEISVDGADGWIRKQDIWGVGVGEVFQ